MSKLFNVDDELRDKVQDICDRVGAGLLPPNGAGAIMKLILADRKKHELQARLNEVQRELNRYGDVFNFPPELLLRKSELRKELEKL